MVEEIRSALIAHSEPEKLPTMQRFFKEPIDAYCTYTDHVRAIARENGAAFAAMSPRERDAITEALWASGKFEEGTVAIFLYARMLRQCGEPEWNRFSLWLDKYIKNWGHCDTLCADVLGPLLIRHPDWIGKLPEWAASSKTYKRRAALVAPLKGLRKGMFRAECEALHARLAGEKEDILKKALKWMRVELDGRPDRQRKAQEERRPRRG
jgi:3-methyladenine DNA glycosylase AlkD